jgi:hypothetical protein
MKKALWLEDQYEDLMEYSSGLARINYLVDKVKSVSAALGKLKKEEYDIYIFDLKILPGENEEWQALDDRKREENPHFDPYLGLELLRFLDKARKEQNELWEKIKFDFSKVIVFSVVNDKNVYYELRAFGIPHQQIVYKSDSKLDTLRDLIKKIQNQEGENE